MIKAHEHLETLYGEKGSALEMNVRSRLSDRSASSPGQEENHDKSAPEEHNIPTTPTNSKCKTFDSFTGGKILLSTPEEDQYLRMGPERHGLGN